MSSDHSYETPDRPYEKWTVKELRSILKKENLSSTGNKVDLIKKLRNNTKTGTSKPTDIPKKTTIPRKTTTSKKSTVQSKSSKKSPTLNNSSFTYLSTNVIPLDLLVEIASQLSLREIHSMCLVNPSLCQSESFWTRIYRLEVGGTPPKNVAQWYMKEMDSFIKLYARKTYDDAVYRLAEKGLVNEISDLIENAKRDKSKIINPFIYETSLAQAARNGHTRVVKYFLQLLDDSTLSKIITPSKLKEGGHLIGYAAKSGNKELVDYLLAQGYVIVKPDFYLFYALKSGNLELIKYGLNNNPDGTNLVVNDIINHETPTDDILKGLEYLFLYAESKYPNPYDYNSLLSAAVSKKSIPLIRLILKHGKDYLTDDAVTRDAIAMSE